MGEVPGWACARRPSQLAREAVSQGSACTEGNLRCDFSLAYMYTHSKLSRIIACSARVSLTAAPAVGPPTQ